MNSQFTKWRKNHIDGVIIGGYFHTMSHLDPILSTIEAYLISAEMAPTAFGERAAGDRHLVRNLRDGRELRRATREKIQAFIEKNPPKSSEAA
jgi:hypothetical protein